MEDWQEDKMGELMRYIRMDTFLGTVEIGAVEAGICSIRFVKEEEPEMEKNSSQADRQDETAEGQVLQVLEEARRQLAEYMEGRRKVFDLPLSLKGTPFQKKVWGELCKIPYGETRTYGQIAAMAGNPKAGRAVGMANHCNPVGIVVPCHRVIGANGKLTGYAGGMDKKEGLLKLERENSGREQAKP